MPAVRHYMVTRTQKLMVRATSASNAILLAEAELEGRDKPENIEGSATGRTRTTNISAEES